MEQTHPQSSTAKSHPDLCNALAACTFSSYCAYLIKTASSVPVNIKKNLKIYVQWHISKIFSDFSALIHFSSLHRLSVALALATVQVVGNTVDKIKKH